MAKLISLVLAVLVVGVTTVEPARLRNVKQSRFFARQEVAEGAPAQTPYPPSGIKPDIPFDLPNGQQQPQEPDYPQEPEEPQEPNNTYLPPDNLLPPAQSYGPPNQFYGPSEASGDGDVQEDDTVEVILPEAEQTDDGQKDLGAEEPEAEGIKNPQSERLASIRPAKLRSAKLQALSAARLNSQKLIAQPIYSTNGALVAFKVLRI